MTLKINPISSNEFANNLSQRLTELETAHYIGMSRAWLRLQRMKGSGPPYIKIGRAIRYDIADLDVWLAKHRVACA
jgi:predicted DNA-binding transcriptional regulator AlpA